MVADRGAQIVMSTDDLEIAEFIARKMAAWDLPCRFVRFLGVGDDGTQVRVES